MTTLATAAVEIVAEADRFEPQLESRLRDAAGSASRASRNLGQRLGDDITQGMSRRLGRSNQVITRSLRGLGALVRTSVDPLNASLDRTRSGFDEAALAALRLTQAVVTVSRFTAGAITGTLGALGRFRDGFADAGAAASRFSGLMGTLGGATRTALNPALEVLARVRAAFADTATTVQTLTSAVTRVRGAVSTALTPALNVLGRFRDGFADAGAAASAFSGTMGTLGGTARVALDATLNALGRFRDGFADANAAASAFSGTMGTLGGTVRVALDSAAASLTLFREGFDDSRVAASAFSGVMGTLGGVASTALSPTLTVLGRFRDGFADANAAASAFSGTMGTLGGVTRTALDGSLNSLGRFRDGFNDAGAAASAFSGTMGTLGGVTRTALDGSLNSLGRFRDGFNDANAAASAFSGTMGTLGGVTRTVFNGVGAAATFAQERVSALGGAATTALTAIQSASSSAGRGLVDIAAGFLATSEEAATLEGRAARLGTSLRSGLSRAVDSTRRLHTSVSTLARGFSNAALASSSLATLALGAFSTLTAAASLTATAAAGAFGTGIAAIGILAAAQSEQVQAEFTDLAEHVVDTMTGISGPIESALSSLASDLQGAFDDLTPSLEASFTDLGPAMSGFFSEISGAIGDMGPLVETASAAFAELLDMLGPALAGSVRQLSDSLLALFETSDPQFFTNFVTGTVDLADSLIDLITWLSAARASFSEQLAPAVRTFSPLFAGLGAGLATVTGAVAEFAGEFLDTAIPALEHMAPLMTQFGEELSGAGDLIAGLVGDLTPALGAIEPFIEGFVEGFTQARDLMVEFLTDLVAYIAPAGSSLEDLARWLGENEGAVRLFGVAVGTVAAVLTTYRLAALAVGLANTLLAGSFRAVGVAIRAIPVFGWIITAIGLLVVVIQQLWERSETFRSVVTNAWESVSDALEEAWDVIEGVFDSFSQGWDRVVEAAQGDTGIARVWEGMQDAVETAWGVIQPIFDQIGETWDFLLGLISGDRSLSDAGGLLTGYFGNLEEIGQTLGGFIVRQLERLPGLVLDALGFLSETVAPWLLEQLRELPGVALEGLVELGTTIADWFTGLPDRIARAVGATDGWLPWLGDLSAVALEHLRELGETIAEYIQGIPDLVRERIGDGAALLAWLRELPGRIVEFMTEYGPQILRGLAIAIGIVVLGIPALLLGLLASILFVLGVIAVEIAKWAWEAFTGMMATAGQAISAGIDNLVAWFAALPGRVLAAIASFGASLYKWGTTSIARLRASLVTAMGRVSTWWQGVWGSIRTTAANIFTGFVTWIAGEAGRLVDRVMGPINTLRRNMGIAFANAVAAIAKAWANLRRVVGAPIEWVVNTAYNEWIRGVWGKVVSKFDGPALPAYTVNFAKGGLFPGSSGGRGAAGVFPGYTPGRDVHAAPLAAFSGGESVLRPEVTRAWGARTTLMLNKLARVGGVKAVRRALMMLFSGNNPFTGMSVPTPRRGQMAFANGGILGQVGGAAAGVASWLQSGADDFSDAMLDFLEDPGGWLRKIFSQVMKYSQMPHSGTGWGKVLRGLPREVIDTLIKKAKDLFSFDGDWAGLGGSVGARFNAATAFARAQSGKPYIWGGVGPRGYDCCIVPGVRVYGPHGAKRIQDMRAGDQVYSYVDGQLQAHTVNAVWQSEYQEVFAVRTRNRKVTASANHPFMRLARSNAKATRYEEADWGGPISMPRGSRGTLVCTVSTCTTVAWSRGMCGTHLDRWRKHGDPRVRQTTGNTYEVQWARADELQRGDLLVQPRKMPSGGQASPLLPGGLPVDVDLAWLIGAMVGDGTVTERGVRLALYGQDREKATRIFKDKFGGNPSHGQSYGLVCSNTAARDMFNSLGMRVLGPKKRVPEAVWGWSEELQQAFLDGYCDADGHRPADTTRHGERTYHSASEELIEDVRALHMSAGHAVSNVSVIKRDKPIVIKGKTVKNALPQYSFTVWGGTGRGEAALRVQPALREWLDSGDFTVAKVLAVTPEGKQETWDMEVDQSHNFIADGVVVHNSGFMSAIHNVLVGRRPYSRRYTTHSFVGSTANGFRRNLNSIFQLGNTHANVGHMAGTLGRMNVESRGSVGVVVGSRARGANNSLFSSRWGLIGGSVGGGSSRMGGEGILYDGGGWLMPGASLVLNKTRKPEAIRTEAQERNVARLVRLVAERVPARGPLVPVDRVADLRAVLGETGAGTGTVVNAPVTVTTSAQDPEVVAFKVAARIARLSGM